LRKDWDIFGNIFFSSEILIVFLEFELFENFFTLKKKKKKLTNIFNRKNLASKDLDLNLWRCILELPSSMVLSLLKVRVQVVHDMNLNGHNFGGTGTEIKPWK
jgi:hypothetical protein